MVNTENTYLYAIDLVNVEKDKVFVTRLTPKSNLEKGRFVIPKLVPGYSLPLMPNLTEKQLALRRYWINE